MNCKHEKVLSYLDGQMGCPECGLTSYLPLDNPDNPFCKIIPAKPKSEFKKFDQGKLRWHLMPEPALEEIMKVFELGASKYGDFNWYDNSSGVQWTRYTNALERHFKKFKRGVDRDEETNLLELAHMLCNGLMLLTYQLENKGIDDRRKVKSETN